MIFLNEPFKVQIGPTREPTHLRTISRRIIFSWTMFRYVYWIKSQPGQTDSNPFWIG